MRAMKTHAETLQAHRDYITRTYYWWLHERRRARRHTPYAAAANLMVNRFRRHLNETESALAQLAAQAVSARNTSA